MPCSMAYCVSSTHSHACRRKMASYYGTYRRKELVFCCPKCIRCFPDMTWSEFDRSHLTHAGEFGDILKKVMSTDERYRAPRSPDYSPTESVAEEEPVPSGSHSGPQHDAWRLTPTQRTFVKRKFVEFSNGLEEKFRSKLAAKEAEWSLQLIATQQELLQEKAISGNLRADLEEKDAREVVILQANEDLEIEIEQLRTKLAEQPVADLDDFDLNSILDRY